MRSGRRRRRHPALNLPRSRASERGGGLVGPRRHQQPGAHDAHAPTMKTVLLHASGQPPDASQAARRQPGWQNSQTDQPTESQSCSYVKGGSFLKGGVDRAGEVSFGAAEGFALALPFGLFRGAWLAALPCCGPSRPPGRPTRPEVGSRRVLLGSASVGTPSCPEPGRGAGNRVLEDARLKPRGRAQRNVLMLCRSCTLPKRYTTTALSVRSNPYVPASPPFGSLV